MHTLTHLNWAHLGALLLAAAWAALALHMGWSNLLLLLGGLLLVLGWFAL